ncbi:MAG: hypothetical protein ACR2GQ_07510 [Gemmatimonadota bacterium]
MISHTPPTPSRRPRLNSCFAVSFLAFLAFLALDASVRVSPAEAQQARWNDERTLEVVGAAIDARRSGRDNNLERYSAYAEGRVLYLTEFGGGAREQAVRSDRVALELRWRRRVGSLQTILGRRDVSWMPTTIRYHIDHLSLVVENFGDRIRIGDGDEVRDVLNPVAPGALGVYEYRLADSLSMYVNERLTEIYRLEVRPLHSDSAAVVGTLDIERQSFAVVRLAVSFTPVSYVDPTVQSVSVDLQNALVSNRVWLPAEQHTEVRRQMQWFDTPFGGTIRTSFKVLSWNLDPPKDDWVPAGHRVRAVNDRDLARYAGWRTDDLDGAADLLRSDSVLFEEIRSEATRVVRGRYLGGTSRLRLHVPSASDVFRVRRAEGLFLGMGGRYDIDGRWLALGHAGYAFGAERLQFSGKLSTRVGVARVGIEGFKDRPADAGPWSVAAGLVSTGGAVIRGDDYLTPFVESGGRLSVKFPFARGTATIALSSASHESVDLHLDPIGDVAPRPVRPVREGTDTRVTFGWDRQHGSLAGSKIISAIAVDAATTGTFDYTRWVAEVTATPTEPDAMWRWEGRGGLAVVTGSAPRQRLLYLGGRGTIPGYGVRAYAGEQAMFVDGSVSRALIYPWVRLRMLGAIGWANGSDSELEPIGLVDSDGLRPSVGAGVGILYDIIRIDAVRGLKDGRWEWMLSVNPQFRSPL